jgi:hypothetical protein
VPPYRPPSEPRSKADAAYALGIISIVFDFFYVPGILAIIWGGRERHTSRKARTGFVCGIIGTVLAGLLTLTFIVVGALNPKPATTVKTAASNTSPKPPAVTSPPTTPAPTTSPPTTPPPTAPPTTVPPTPPTTVPPRPQPLTWKGQGQQSTSVFQLAGGDYTETWRFSGACFYGGNLNPKDGSPGQTLGSGMGPVSGSDNLYNVAAGTYYIEMISGPPPSCPWTFTLQQQ